MDLTQSVLLVFDGFHGLEVVVIFSSCLLIPEDAGSLLGRNSGNLPIVPATPFFTLPDGLNGTSTFVLATFLLRVVPSPCGK